MAREYFPFIDWMKAAGISLIVIGHVAGDPINHAVPPIYPKQLGVAFFMFVVGFSLARERRSAWQVLFNRLFEIYLFGLAIALTMSVIMYATRGTLNASNYLPFFFGANVVFNNFPANPTTWYIGTYFHVVVLWTVFVRRIRVQGWTLAVAMVIEVTIRAALLANAGEYIAYMLVPNWMTVFLVGTWFGQHPHAQPAESARAVSGRRTTVTRYSLLLAGFAVTWPIFVGPHVQQYTFPFMRLSSIGAATGALVTAVPVSIVYLTYTVLVFQVSRRFTAPGWVRFVARNTLIVFIAHMPLFYALNPVIEVFGISSYPARAVVRLLGCLVVPAAVSDGVHRMVRPRDLRVRLADRLGRLLPAIAARA